MIISLIITIVLVLGVLFTCTLKENWRLATKKFFIEFFDEMEGGGPFILIFPLVLLWGIITLWVYFPLIMLGITTFVTILVILLMKIFK